MVVMVSINDRKRTQRKKAGDNRLREITKEGTKEDAKKKKKAPVRAVPVVC